MSKQYDELVERMVKSDFHASNGYVGPLGVLGGDYGVVRALTAVSPSVNSYAALRAENERLQSELIVRATVWGDLAASTARVGVLLEENARLREALDSAVSKIDNCDVDAVKLASRSDFYGITGTRKVPPAAINEQMERE